MANQELGLGPDGLPLNPINLNANPVIPNPPINNLNNEKNIQKNPQLNVQISN